MQSEIHELCAQSAFHYNVGLDTKICCFLRNANYSLDDGKPFIDVLIKMTTQCYFNQMDSDGCLTYEANELAEYCVKTLTVNKREIFRNIEPSFSNDYCLMLFYSIIVTDNDDTTGRPSVPKCSIGNNDRNG